MAFEFGDKILFQGIPAVYLHGDITRDGAHVWVSVKDGNEIKEMWVQDNDIIHVDQVSDYPQDVTRNIRDKMILIFGQLLALQYGCDSNTGHALESIGIQFERLIKQLFKDYE